MTPAGALTTLHSFNSTDGANPTGALTQAANGLLWGTTYGGGANGYGTIFKMRSEERRVGKEGRSRWPPFHSKKRHRTVTIVDTRQTHGGDACLALPVTLPL